MSTTARDTDPAGEPGSIIPGARGPGMLPPTPDRVDDDYPVGARLRRDPSNLGDEVSDEGDIVCTTPEPSDTANL
jgi:hypothetical protein